MPAVTPTISIAGAPAALSNGKPYTATVDTVAGLTHSWSVSDGSITTAITGDSITFTAGDPGVALLNVDTTNTGGDTAAPAVLGINVVAAPITYKDQTAFDVPSIVTEDRAGIPLRALNPIDALTYHWTVDGNATVEPTGTTAHLLVGDLGGAASGALTVHAYAENSVGAQSNTVDYLVTVVPPRVELVAGTETKGSSVGGSNDGKGVSAGFGGPFVFGGPDTSVGMSLAVSQDSKNLYVGDYVNQILRRVRTADGTVTTIAGVAFDASTGPDNPCPRRRRDGEPQLSCHCTLAKRE